MVDDIYDTKLTFSYQYFIKYSLRYERPICARIPDNSPDIRYLIWKTPIRYDPDLRYLEPCNLQGKILQINNPSKLILNGESQEY